MNRLWMRQIGGVMRLELKKTFLSRRGWWIYCLAAGAGGASRCCTGWWNRARAAGNHNLGDDSITFAAMFLFFYLRAGIFFGCMGIFSNLFRGEMLEKTLHYYFLTPMRRELLVAGKYLAGLVVALVLLVSSVTAAFLIIGRHSGAAWTRLHMARSRPEPTRLLHAGGGAGLRRLRRRFPDVRHSVQEPHDPRRGGVGLGGHQPVPAQRCSRKSA